MQQAFIDEQAAQCGFCVNGVILTAKAFLDKNPKASQKDIQQALSGVLCRCFSHVRMHKAIEKYAGLAKSAVSASPPGETRGHRMAVERLRP